MSFTYPENYQLLNDSNIKNLNVVIEFEGTPTTFSLVPTLKKLRYGDPGIIYGDGHTYGELIPVPNNLAILSQNSNLTISQTVEPEQGRASVATMSLEFIDLNGFMTQFVSPGKTFNEILGSKLVKIYIGYVNSSFKEDYFVIFRGYVSNITAAPSRIIMQLSDANLKRRQQIFKFGQTILSSFSFNFTSADVNNVANTITIAGHTFQNGNRVQLTTTGTLPPPITAGTDYFIVNATSTTIQLAATEGGTAIDFTSSGSGSSTITITGTGSSATKIYAVAPSDFIQQIQGPDSTYDSAITTYIKIDNEIMSYGPTGIGSNFFTVTRAQRGTLATDHDIPSDPNNGNKIDNSIQIQGNIIDNSLKLMLSGWNGVWISGIVIRSFVQTDDPDIGNINNAIVLPDQVDAVRDYGFSPGDYLYVTGASNSGNNGTFIITGFLDRLGFSNNIILVSSTLVIEEPTSAVMSSRSQYDTFPVDAGSKLKPVDVDVNQFQYIKTNFVFHSYDTFSNYIDNPKSGKEFIEKEYMLPSGCYSITRFGRISCTITKPPLVGDNLVIFDKTNVIEPQNISVVRGLNNRRFFDDIQYFFDYDNSDNFQSEIVRFDSDSLTNFDVDTVLPIQARGLRTSLGAEQFVNQRVDFLLKRYKNVATEIALKCNWKAASLIEVGDIVAVKDNGDLQINNFDTGTRDLGFQLFEVIQRAIDIKSGQGTIKLLGSTGYLVTDRFAGIAPSSIIDSGSTTSVIVIKDSYGAKYPLNEHKKWDAIIGDQIAIHSQDYSFYQETTLVGFDPSNKYKMQVSPALSSPPPAGYIVDLAKYSNDGLATTNQKSKTLFSYIDPTVTVVSGISPTQFTVSSGDATKFTAGLQIKIHSDDYTVESSEQFVDSIVGTTITLKAPIEFTPSSGQKVELVGFTDGGGAFRLL